jgi:hypothetical protein
VEQPQVETSTVDFPGIPYIAWDSFIAFSAHRNEVLDKYINPRIDYPKTVKAEMALVNALQAYMVRQYSLTPHEVFMLWEHWTQQYRRTQVQLLLAKVEEKSKAGATLKVSSYPNA